MSKRMSQQHKDTICNSFSDTTAVLVICKSYKKFAKTKLFQFRF